MADDLTLKEAVHARFPNLIEEGRLAANPGGRPSNTIDVRCLACGRSSTHVRNGSRFGYHGAICPACYGRLYMRARRAP